MSEIPESVFEYINSMFSLNKQQVLYANYVMKELSSDYDNYHNVHPHKINKQIEELCGEKLTDNDASYVLNKLENDLYFIDKHYDTDWHKITLSGAEIIQKHGELITYLMSEIKDTYEEAAQNLQEKAKQDEIDTLTIKQLKGSIFQVKYWWLFLIINAAISLIIAWLFS